MSRAAELFGEILPGVLRDSPERAREVGGSFLFVLKGSGGGVWRVDLERTPPEILAIAVAEAAMSARCTIQADVQDFEAMLDQPASVLKLYKEGRLRVSGDLDLAGRLHLLFAE